METLVFMTTAFVLASFVGFELLTKVPATLHTPLMSGANAISGIVLLGAIESVSTTDDRMTVVMGCIAIALATVNVVAGFTITNRMLRMFRQGGAR